MSQSETESGQGASRQTDAIGQFAIDTPARSGVMLRLMLGICLETGSLTTAQPVGRPEVNTIFAPLRRRLGFVPRSVLQP